MLNPLFGTRLANGIWPPSKPGLTPPPERHSGLYGPCPPFYRCRNRDLCLYGRRLCWNQAPEKARAISWYSHLLVLRFGYLNEVRNLGNLAAGGLVIRLRCLVTDFFESQRVRSGDLVLFSAIQALTNLIFIAIATSLTQDLLNGSAADRSDLVNAFQRRPDQRWWRLQHCRDCWNAGTWYGYP